MIDLTRPRGDGGAMVLGGFRWRTLAAVLGTCLLVVSGCSGDPEPDEPTPPSPPTPEPTGTTTPADASAPLLGASHVLMPDPAGDGLLAVTGPPDGVADGGPLVVWRWSGGEWSEVEREDPWPTARNFFAAAYDSKRDVLVLHGGDTASGPSPETWEWDGELWTAYGSPGPRLAAAMAFDPASATVVMYGGDDGAGALKNQTWGWDGASWQQLSAQGPRPHRFPAALTAAAGGGELVMYGGHQVVDEDLPPSLGDTWTWDGRAWNPELEAGGPGELVNAGAVTHPRLGTLLVGGSDFDEESGDVWRWTRDGWQLLAEGVFPPRQAFGLAYDEARDVVVMTGGVVEPGELTRYQDLWEWSGDPDHPATLVVDRPPA